MDGRERRSAVITGAAQGIGLACARRLTAAGATVTLLDANGKRLEEALQELNRDGAHAVGYEADVSSRRRVLEVIKATTDAVGPPQILVNCAGVIGTTDFLGTNESEWDRVVNVSLKGAFFCSQACVPRMREARWGRIVNLSSIAGRNVSRLGGVAYTSAKAGVLGLTRAVATEVAGFGITVNAVCPGIIDTQLVREVSGGPNGIEALRQSIPLGRLGRADDVAGLVAYLCSEDASYVTGASFDVNGGLLMI